MNLEGMLNISGKPGLFKVVSNTKNTVIVESLTDGKRRSIHSNYQANMLEEMIPLNVLRYIRNNSLYN